jgi:phage terminase Nu1 subunit (DNA packaging protein)
MRTKLEKLIAAYEAERASLTAEMEECVAEMDYGKAHLFFKGLARVNQQLQTLYNLQDKCYDEKEHLTHAIKLFEERLVDVKDGDYTRDYYTQSLADKKEKLAELTQASAQKVSVGQTVRAMLGKLLVGELATFTLVLQDSERLHCHVKAVRRTLLLTVPEIRRHKANNTLRGSHVRKFLSLGFRLYDSKDKLILFAPYSTLEEVNAVQRILARITFEVFYFKELADETFIKYYL